MRNNGPSVKSRNAAFQELNPSGNYDNMSSEDMQTLIGGLMDQMKRKELLKDCTITQLPNGRWYTRIQGKKHERTERKDIEDLIIDFKKGRIATINNTFSGFMVRRKTAVSSRTWAKDKHLYETYIQTADISNKPLVELNCQDAYSFLDHCLTVKRDMQYKYWKNILITLNQFFIDAIQSGIISMNPFHSFRPNKDRFVPRKIVQDCDTIFSPEELELVTQIALEDAEAKHSSLPLGILVIKHLGIRDGELCALKWGDIVEKKKFYVIHIQREMVSCVTEDGKYTGFEVLNHCKTPKGDRLIPLSPKCLEVFGLIRKYNTQNGIPTGPSDLIFQRIRKGQIELCSPRCFYGRFARYCRMAGMDVVKSPHDMRRTFVTMLNDAQMNIKKIQQYAGHASLAQTMDYIKHREVTDEDLEYLSTL